MKRFYVLLAVVALVAFMPAGRAAADNNDQVQAVPFTFVGTAAQCGGTAGSRIVTAAWLGGMGLPDNGGPNATTPGDPHSGLLLNKNGPTPDCSSSGARITGVNGMIVTATTALGFDYRLGGHCGAGAPRFNVDTDKGSFFVGCANAPQSPAPQDPAQWMRTRSVLATCGVECFPSAIPVGAKISSISIVYDEGTDTANSDTLGVGLAVIDNIFINGQVITSGPPGGNKGKGKDKDKDKDKHENGDDDDQGEDD